MEYLIFLQTAKVICKCQLYIWKKKGARGFAEILPDEPAGETRGGAARSHSDHSDRIVSVLYDRANLARIADGVSDRSGAARSRNDVFYAGGGSGDDTDRGACRHCDDTVAEACGDHPACLSARCDHHGVGAGSAGAGAAGAVGAEPDADRDGGVRCRCISCDCGAAYAFWDRAAVAAGIFLSDCICTCILCAGKLSGGGV